MENLEPVFFNVEELRTLRINLWDKKDKLKSKVLKLEKDQKTPTVVSQIVEIRLETAKLDSLTQKLAEAIRRQTALDEELKSLKKNLKLKELN